MSHQSTKVKCKSVGIRRKTLVIQTLGAVGLQAEDVVYDSSTTNGL